MNYTYTDSTLFLYVKSKNVQEELRDNKIDQELSRWSRDQNPKGSKPWTWWTNKLIKLKVRRYILKERQSYEQKALQISIQREHSCNERLVRS